MRPECGSSVSTLRDKLSYIDFDVLSKQLQLKIARRTFFSAKDALRVYAKIHSSGFTSYSLISISFVLFLLFFFFSPRMSRISSRSSPIALLPLSHDYSFAIYDLRLFRTRRSVNLTGIEIGAYRRSLCDFRHPASNSFQPVASS